MRLLEWWNIPRRGWVIILTQLAIIITLGSWVYAEYVNNAYFQSYVNSLSPILVPIVSVSFGLASATVATMLYFTMRSVRQRGGVRQAEQNGKRGPAKKIVKRSQVSTVRGERVGTVEMTMMPKLKAGTAGTSLPKRGRALESGDKEDE